MRKDELEFDVEEDEEAPEFIRVTPILTGPSGATPARTYRLLHTTHSRDTRAHTATYLRVR